MGEVTWGWVALAAMVSGLLGFGGAAVLAAGAREDDRQAFARKLQEKQAAHDEHLQAAEKRAYDSGWDACDLMHKRKRQAAAQQAAATRKRGGRDVA